MKVIGKDKIHDFCQCHADVRSQLAAWLREAEAADWQRPEHIKARYATASFLQENTVIFNIKGNKYRLVATVNYKFRIVQILAVLTHKQYDEWSF